jgi:hypothetical protein
MLEIKPEFLAMTLQMPSWRAALHQQIDLGRMVNTAQRKLFYGRGQGCSHRR